MDPDKMGQLYVKVSDTGVGIPKADLVRLFRDFITLQCNAHLNPNGVGLGLSTCKKITNLLHGDITVESAESVGTSFTFHVGVKFESEGTPQKLNEKSGQDDSVVHASNMPDLPTDFSLLIGRMQAVYKQFQT
jgi:hypothetical protein